MTLLESLEKHLAYHIKGVQVFNRNEIIKNLKNHNLIFADEIKFDDSGEHLIIKYDETTVCFQIRWRQDGPRHTLTDIRLI